MRNALLALSLLAAPQARAQPAPISIEHPWARATAPSATTAAIYFTIVDHGPPDRLISATTPVATASQLHAMTMQGDVMRMREVDDLAVSSAAPVTLSPGGYHLMLTGLKSPLRRGDSIPLTLTFAHAGTIEVSVPVEAIGARGPVAATPGHSMDMTMPMTHAKP